MAALLEQGARSDDLVLGVRDPEKARRLGFGNLETRWADYDDPESLHEAFRGTDVLLLIPTSEPVVPRLRQHANALSAAEECRVERVVFSSFQACGPDSRFRRARFYREAESGVREVAPSWTILRSGLYLEFVSGHAARRRSDRTLRLPVEHGKAAYISRDDVARGLAAVCLQSGHDGRTYELTGERPHSLADVVGALSAAAGHPIGYITLTGEEYAARLRGHGLAEPVIEVWRSVWEAVEAGELERATDHVDRLTGRPPAPLADQFREIMGTESTEES